MGGKSMARSQTSPHTFTSPLNSAAQQKNPKFLKSGCCNSPGLKTQRCSNTEQSASPGALSISHDQKAVLEDTNFLSELIATISSE